MIYKAIVLDNSMLFTRGTIRVRIAGHFNRKINWNLEENFPDEIELGKIEGSEYSKDFEAILTGPIGGGRNYGGLIIPQINEKGIVAFLGGSKADPVWLGGLFETKRDDSFNVEVVNFPSDKFEDGENTDAIIGEEVRLGDEIELPEEKSIILRTKHTNINSAEELDFQQQHTSNIISIGKKRIRVTHFEEEDWEEGTAKSYKDFLIGINEENEEVISLIYKKEEDQTKLGLEIKNEESNFIYSNEEMETKVSLKNEESNFLYSIGDEIKANIKLNEEGVLLEDGNGSKIHINNEGEIIITSENVKVVGDAEVSGNVKIAGAGDSVALYSDLLSIIEKLESHLHIAPSGPTTPPLESNNAPLAPGIIGAKRNMQSKSLETD